MRGNGMKRADGRGWKKAGGFGKLDWSSGGMDQLEPRAMLAADARFTPTALNWNGINFTNVVANSWVVTFQGEQSQAQAQARVQQVATALGVRAASIDVSVSGMFARLTSPDRITENAVAQARQQLGFLRQVQPEELRFIQRQPNDAEFARQWPHLNTGQAAGNSGPGTAGADIKSTNAWDISTGNRRVVVAVLDTGTDLTHPDLRDNLWQNPGEIPGDGVDNDNNGLTDDVFGYDFADQDANPQDAPNEGHGTAVAGVIGAVGNNGIGVAGVNWQVSMITCKIFSDQGGGAPTFSIINALDYITRLRNNGVNIVVSNNSYGAVLDNQTTNFDNAEEIAIQRSTDAGILFVAAAGNESLDNDGTAGSYPANYPNVDIVSAAATDNRDGLADFSNYGRTKVDLGAPGVQTYTTAVGGGYQYIDGTSFASPYTAGVVALMASVNRFATKNSLRTGLLGGVDVIPSLQGKVATNGRLNAEKAVRNARVDGLFVSNISPGTQATTVTQIQVEFNADVDPAFFNSSRVELRRANGGTTFAGQDTIVPLTSGQFVLSGRVLTINLGAALPRDLYRLILRNDGFRDTLGNRLNGDQNTGNDEIYDFNIIAFRGPFEPNDTLATATPIVLGAATSTTIRDVFLGDGNNPASDVDIFKVSTTGASLLSARVASRSLGIFSSLDSYIRVFNSSGEQIAFNDNYEGLDSFVQVFVPGAGDYYIAVSAFPNSTYNPSIETGRSAGGSTGTYNLAIGVQTSQREVINRAGDAPRDIPAIGDIISTINVTDGRTVTDVAVRLNITHSFVSDLRITLTSPGGQVVTLFDRRGGSGQNLTNTIFADSATATIASGAAPFTGRFKPEQQLTPFKNRSAAGVWTLRISDLKPLDQGTLNSWSIDFDTNNDVSGPYELNDTVLLATDTTIDGTGVRTFDAAVGDGAFGLRDVDLFRFTAGTGTTITAQVNVTDTSGLRTILRLFDSQGTEIRADRRQGVSTNLINFVVANAGVYYIGVSGGSRSTVVGVLGNDSYNATVGGSGTETDSTGSYRLTINVSGGISEGSLVLTGNGLNVGVGTTGAIGASNATTNVGLASGGVDYLLSGGAITSYYGATFDGFVIRNTADGSQTDLPVSVNSESDANNRRAVVTGVYRSLGVRRTLSFGLNDQYIAIDVTLTNRSGVVINNLGWLEGLGTQLAFNSTPAGTTTLNNVKNGSMRLATSTFGGRTLGIGAAAGGNVVTSFGLTNAARDPIQVVVNPFDPDTSVGDTGAQGQQDMVIAYTLGSLGPNQSTTIRYFVFAGAASQVTTAFNLLDAGNGSGHLVSDPRASALPTSSLPFVIYYPEGYANNRASTFLPIVNAGAEGARVVVIAHYELAGGESNAAKPADVLYDSATDTPGGLVLPGSRSGITLTTPALYSAGTSLRVQSQIAGRPGVLKDTPYSIEIRSSAPVGATFSHYDFNITTGQSAVSQTGTTWTFAQAQKGAGINDFVVFYNPNNGPVKVTLTTIPADGTAGFSIVSRIEGNRRGGFSLQALSGIGNGTFGIKLDADLPIVAALSHFNSNQQTGYGAVGLSSLGSTSGATGQGQVGLTATSEFVSVLNPGSLAADVTLTFAFGNASSYRRTVRVEGLRQTQLNVLTIPGFPRGQVYSVTYQSTQPVTVSLPSTTTQGASGATLVSRAQSQWLFGEGFRPLNGTAVREYVRVFNPSLLDSTIEIQLSFNDGTSEVFRRTVTGRATSEFDLFDFVTGLKRTQGTVTGVGSFYGTRIISATPVVAFMGHYDSFLGGGFGLAGTPIGTTGTPN